MGRHAEEIQWLKKALEVEPKMESALINLGSYYQVIAFAVLFSNTFLVISDDESSNLLG